MSHIIQANKDWVKLSIETDINAITTVVHGCMAELGWWKDSKTGIDLVQCIRDPKGDLDIFVGKSVVATKLCLVHSEISEAMEGARKDLMDDKLPHRKMVEVELADAMIRIMDLAGAMGLDLGAAVAEKLAYNTQRADHKVENREKAGGKAF